MHLGVAGEQIEPLRFAAGKQVHGKVVAQRGRRRHGIVLALCGKLHKPVVGLLVDHGALFNPADLVLFGLDLEKAPCVFQNLQRLPVHHLANAV